MLVVALVVVLSTDPTDCCARTCTDDRKVVQPVTCCNRSPILNTVTNNNFIVTAIAVPAPCPPREESSLPLLHQRRSQAVLNCCCVLAAHTILLLNRHFGGSVIHTAVPSDYPNPPAVLASCCRCVCYPAVLSAQPSRCVSFCLLHFVCARDASVHGGRWRETEVEARRCFLCDYMSWLPRRQKRVLLMTAQQRLVSARKGRRSANVSRTATIQVRIPRFYSPINLYIPSTRCVFLFLGSLLVLRAEKLRNYFWRNNIRHDATT